MCLTQLNKLRRKRPSSCSEANELDAPNFLPVHIDQSAAYNLQVKHWQDTELESSVRSLACREFRTWRLQEVNLSPARCRLVSRPSITNQIGRSTPNGYNASLKCYSNNVRAADNDYRRALLICNLRSDNGTVIEAQLFGF